MIFNIYTFNTTMESLNIFTSVVFSLANISPDMSSAMDEFNFFTLVQY